MSNYETVLIERQGSVAVVSLDIGGQLGTTAEVENYPGIASVTGPKLVAQFVEQLGPGSGHREERHRGPCQPGLPRRLVRGCDPVGQSKRLRRRGAQGL